MNLPSEFVDTTKKILNGDWLTFEQSLTETPPVSVRLNKAKCTGFLPLTDKVDWCENAYYLAERPSFTFDPLFHAGCYYPQEASSMFVGQVVDQLVEGDVRVLDLCAAPGGKSTLIMSLLSEDSLLVSNEVIRTRAHILSENVTKWGYSNSMVINNDPSEIGRIDSFFDVILVDAPCSGEGMFRKDEAAIGEWSEANVQLCKERQQRIVADVWSSLKSDGLLIYSTCTYNTDENEDNVQWICDELGAEAVALSVPHEWNITGALKGDLPVYRFLPHKTKGEGFFLAVLRKKEDNNITRKPKNKRKDNKKAPVIPNEYKNCLIDAGRYSFFLKTETWCAVPSVLADDYDYLASMLKVVSGGVQIGETKGKDFVLNQSLALSLALNRSNFVCCEVDRNTAITYLQKQALVLDNVSHRGYVLLTYQNIPLGFVKNIGNRANNLYPQEWRIRSAHVPESDQSFLTKG